CAMAASVWAARAFATRPREGTGVECCLLRPNLLYLDTLFTSTPDSATPDPALLPPCLLPTHTFGYLVCASGRVVEMWNAEGTALSIRGFVATSDLHGAKCACNGSTLI
ncbi:hypothetical protein Pcinc_038931, partial [Petrolisthes cinctipes]